MEVEAEPGQALVISRVAVDPRLPLDVFAGALALSLWVASGSVVLAIANGLGDHPTRRLVSGLLLVGASAFMLLRRDAVARVLRCRPWLVLPLAAAQLGPAIVDGLIGGAYVAFSLTSVGIAVIVARARTVWLCVALLMASYATGVLAGRSPAALVDDGQLASVLGAMISYPVAALLFMGLRRCFTRFIATIESTLDDIRAGAPAFTPALAHVIRGMPLALAPPPPAELTPTERRVVEGLATGRAAKELAHAWGVSLATVRTHIKNAKRKTGTRTLRELATLPSRPDWSKSGSGGA
jgi:DNA-binding CsgD family transcriptional regulator